MSTVWSIAREHEATVKPHKSRLRKQIGVLVDEIKRLNDPERYYIQIGEKRFPIPRNATIKPCHDSVGCTIINGNDLYDECGHVTADIEKHGVVLVLGDNHIHLGGKKES